MLLWKWRVRRAIKPLVDEQRTEQELVERGADEWVRWWRLTGERELRCILMTAWDPIAVGDTPEAWDEYDSYAPGLARRLRDATGSDDGARDVTDYLNHVERDFMENLTAERRRVNGYLADSLLAWHEWSFTRGGRSPRDWLDED